MINLSLIRQYIFVIIVGDSFYRVDDCAFRIVDYVLDNNPSTF